MARFPKSFLKNSQKGEKLDKRVPENVTACNALLLQISGMQTNSNTLTSDLLFYIIQTNSSLTSPMLCGRAMICRSVIMQKLLMNPFWLHVIERYLKQFIRIQSYEECSTALCASKKFLVNTLISDRIH